MKTKQSVNLMEGLLQEIDRVKEMVAEYKSLPKNAGYLASVMMEQDIKNAQGSISEGDTVKMLRAFTVLQEYQN